MAAREQIVFCPLSQLLPNDVATFRWAKSCAEKWLAGKAGWVANNY
jgi:hypothetical protein